MQVVEHRVEVLGLVRRDASPSPLPRRAKVDRQLDLFILREQALRDGGRPQSEDKGDQSHLRVPDSETAERVLSKKQKRVAIDEGKESRTCLSSNSSSLNPANSRSVSSTSSCPTAW